MGSTETKNSTHFELHTVPFAFSTFYHIQQLSLAPGLTWRFIKLHLFDTMHVGKKFPHFDALQIQHWNVY